jgi:hypothetical protein
MSKPRFPRWPADGPDSTADEVQLTAVALLCLLFAWPPEEPIKEPSRQPSP